MLIKGDVKMEDLLNELFVLSKGRNVAELISEFEQNYTYNILLEFKGIYKKDNLILIKVFDKITECLFELFYDSESDCLEVYHAN